ncbi:MAG: SDR family oxidoreductase [Clostridia bacterium]|nr:SDR family oxidoreductase [Clostridia bacterium]
MNINDYRKTLDNKIILITGAGGGIGFETAKCFAIMGAKVIILEVDKEKGENAERTINSIYKDKVEFYNIDLAEENSILKMKKYVLDKYGCPDIIFNNAAILHLGEIGKVSSNDWDNGYLVNFKAPVLLVNCFIDEMRRRNSGTFVFVSSSGAIAYMGAYEIFKTAQVELSNTLSMELENTNIYSYTISPGLVKTETAMKSIEVVAKSMNISLEEFYEMNKEHIISVEDAAFGFALSVLNAKEYNGQEIGSIQVLNGLESRNESYGSCNFELLSRVIKTYEEQYLGWKERNIFERQWVLRDFKKCVGKSADEVYKIMKSMKKSKGILSTDEYKLLESLIVYWEHQYQLLQGFEKNKEKLQENSNIIKGWILDIKTCINKQR